MPDGYLRADMLAHGEGIASVFGREGSLFAIGRSGRLYRMVFSYADEDGQREVVTLHRVDVDVMVPRPVKVDD